MTAVTWARFVIIAPVLTVAALVAVALKLAGALPREVGGAFVVLAIAAAALTITAQHTIALVEVQGRMKLSALWIVLGQAAGVIGLLAIIVTGNGKSTVAIVALTVISPLVVTIALATRSWRTGLWPPAFDGRVRRRVMSFSAPLVAFTLSSSVIASVDLVVIRAYRPAADVGIYAVAYRGYAVLQSVALASGPVLTPLFVSLKLGGREQLVREFVDRTVTQMTLIGSVLAGVAGAAVKLVVVTLVGRSFRGAAAPLTVLVLAGVLFFMANLLGSVLVLYERTRTVGLVNLGAAAINVVGDILFVGVLNVGIVGAAIATTCAVAFIWAGYLATARQCVGLSAFVNPLVLAPAALGIAAPLASASAGIVLLGALTAVLLGLVILRFGGVMAAEDAALIARLNMPRALRSKVLRLIAIVSR